MHFLSPMPKSLHHSNSAYIALGIHSMLEICFNGADLIFAPWAHFQMSSAGKSFSIELVKALNAMVMVLKKLLDIQCVLLYFSETIVNKFDAILLI